MWWKVTSCNDVFCWAKLELLRKKKKIQALERKKKILDRTANQ